MQLAMFNTEKFVLSCTKNEMIQAFILEVFINQHSFFSTNAASQKPDEVSMLKFSDQDDFILELFNALL